MKRKLLVTALAAGALSLGCQSSDSPTSPVSGSPVVRASLVPEAAYAWFQGFEIDQDGWLNFGVGTLNREASGYSNTGGYADGIASAHGGWHARLRTNACAISCGGPFTRWGGYGLSSVPYITEVDIYLDVAWATGRPDVRFDFSSAINNATNTAHRRDFVFNAGTSPDGLPQFVVSASNNAGRANSYPSDPGRSPVTITVSGWYTFRHTFRDQAGVLAVDLDIVNHAGVAIGHWTLSDATDLVALIGGNRYGWFANQEINDLAIDQSGRINGATPPPPAPVNPQTKDDCKNGGWEPYGFKNQGQCIQYVITGKDSR